MSLRIMSRKVKFFHGASKDEDEVTETNELRARIMPRKAKIIQGASKEEDEATVTNELRALNMLEDGMSVEDKKHLLKVIRMSQTTADEERRSRTKRKKPQDAVLRRALISWFEWLTNSESSLDIS